MTIINLKLNNINSHSISDKSNWLGLLPLGTQDTANVWLYEEDNELYAISVKTIMPRVPLRLGYSKQYAVQHSLPNGQPILDLTKGDILNK